MTGAKVDLRTFLQAFRLAFAQRELAEQQSISRLDRERAYPSLPCRPCARWHDAHAPGGMAPRWADRYFFLLLGLVEDLPFCILNSVLLAIPVPLIA